MMEDTPEQKTARIRALNDALRRCGRGGRIVITAGIEALGSQKLARILGAVAAFDNFSEDNDPYGEHDCAILRVDGLQVLFKIDYYDRTLTAHSDDPSDPAVTERVMTVMLAEEY
jgi:Protein of unknown function (DUF3768)